MLTTYWFFPTAAGNMEACAERAESPPHCLMLALQPAHSSVRTFLSPNPGTPHQGGAQAFREEKRVAESTAKLGKARQMVSRDRLSNLNPAKWKLIALKGGELLLLRLVIRTAKISALCGQPELARMGESPCLYLLPSLHCWLEASPQQQPLAPAWGPPMDSVWVNNIHLPWEPGICCRNAARRA